MVGGSKKRARKVGMNYAIARTVPVFTLANIMPEKCWHIYCYNKQRANYYGTLIAIAQTMPEKGVKLALNLL